jgi:hypothetical protein
VFTSAAIGSRKPDFSHAVRAAAIERRTLYESLSELWDSWLYSKAVP